MADELRTIRTDAAPARETVTRALEEAKAHQQRIRDEVDRAIEALQKIRAQL